MTPDKVGVRGARTLVVGASSGIGEAFAVAARSRGARVALAARRIDKLMRLAAELDSTAHQLDVGNPDGIQAVVDEVAEDLGGLDVLVFTSAVLPFAQVADTDVSTWLHAFTVNAVGASQVLRAALPHLSESAVIVVTSTHAVGHPRAGMAAYNASKAALEELLRSWRCEHPALSIIRVSVGPTTGTELLRGADRDLLEGLYEKWEQHRQVPEIMSQTTDVANALVSIVAAARDYPSVVTEVVRLAPRFTDQSHALTMANRMRRAPQLPNTDPADSDIGSSRSPAPSLPASRPCSSG